MQFADAAERLTDLPAALPEGPEALIPVLAETGASGPGRVATSRPPGQAAVLVLRLPGRGRRGVRAADRARRPRRAPLRRGVVPGRPRRAGRRRRDRDRAARSGRGGRAGRRSGGRPRLGAWPPLWIPVSDYAVTPVLATGGAAAVVHAPALRGGPGRRGAGPGDPARRGAERSRARHPRLADPLRRLPDRWAGRLGDDGPRARRGWARSSVLRGAAERLRVVRRRPGCSRIGHLPWTSR